MESRDIFSVELGEYSLKYFLTVLFFVSGEYRGEYHDYISRREYMDTVLSVRYRSSIVNRTSSAGTPHNPDV